MHVVLQFFQCAAHQHGPARVRKGLHRRTALGGTHSQRDPAPPAKDFTQKYDTNRISMFVSEIPARYG